MINLGIPIEIIEKMMKIHSLVHTRVFFPQFDFKQKWKMPIQRVTGAAETSLGNSLGNLMASVYAIMGFFASNRNQSVPSLIAELGFEMKYKESDSILGMTFLKGSFLKDNCDQWMWLPLPSQVLKLGKILTDPCKIFPKLNRQEAEIMCARAMALGLGTVPYNYPILGPFITKMRTLSFSSYNNTQIEHQWFPEHKIKVDSYAYCNRKMALEMYGLRYGLTEEHILDLEHHISLVKTIPIVMGGDWTPLLLDYA